jgi:CRISPR/Cas system-associated endonuclease Cas1
VTISGYGVKVLVRSGHLHIEDGGGSELHTIRLPRVGHGLKRLVCISDDGFITLSALKWLSDVGAAFVMLNRLGRVQFVTGPTSPSDARLRRSQAVALTNGVGLEISGALIHAKLEGQERLVRTTLGDSISADLIAQLRGKLEAADRAEQVRVLEAHAAIAYFGGWRDAPVLWPKADLRKIPERWRTIGTRQSSLSGGPRLAVTFVHAIGTLIREHERGSSKLQEAGNHKTH